MNNKRYIDVVASVFIFCVITSNLLSSAKLISIAGFTLDAGILLFPIAYIIGDIAVDVYGYALSRRIIWTGFILSALFAGVLYLVSALPSDPIWEEAVGQVAYNSVLGGVSGLMLASLTGYLLGEFTNAKTLVWFKDRGYNRIAYYIISTLTGEAVDTVMFFVVAGVMGVFPIELLIELIVLNYIIKVSIEVIVSPLTAQIAKRLNNA